MTAGERAPLDKQQEDGSDTDVAVRGTVLRPRRRTGSGCMHSASGSFVVLPGRRRQRSPGQVTEPEERLACAAGQHTLGPWCGLDHISGGYGPHKYTFFGSEAGPCWCFVLARGLELHTCLPWEWPSHTSSRPVSMKLGQALGAELKGDVGAAGSSLVCCATVPFERCSVSWCPWVSVRVFCGPLGWGRPLF